MKMSKKSLASQVNSVRPYKSRSKRPCDFCRRRKTCCIIDKSIPCMACAQFNKGQCTFLEQPVKRNKAKALSGEQVSKSVTTHSTNSQPRVDSVPSLQSQSSRWLGEQSYYGAGATTQVNTSFANIGTSSWQKVMGECRSRSSDHVPLSSPHNSRDLVYSNSSDLYSAQGEHRNLHSLPADEYKLHARKEQWESATQRVHAALRQHPVPHAREPEPYESSPISHLSYGTPHHYHYGSTGEVLSSLDNSEFSSSGSNSSSSTKLHTWSSESSATEAHTMELSGAGAGTEVLIDKLPATYHSQPIQPYLTGSYPMYYHQDNYTNFVGGGYFGGALTSMAPQASIYSSAQMK